ncbi:MAG: DegV family protein [Oscillibacter sp.]
MMKLIADSSANLTMLEGVTYQSVPMTIRAGERDFVDDETLDTHELLDYLAAHNGKSGTACPSLDGWLKAFEGADEIFVITITSSLSGTCASAMAARDVYLQSHPEVKIHIFDTLSTGPEMQLLAEKLAELHAKGLPFDVVCEKAQEYLAYRASSSVLSPCTIWRKTAASQQNRRGRHRHSRHSHPRHRKSRGHDPAR